MGAGGREAATRRPVAPFPVGEPVGAADGECAGDNTEPAGADDTGVGAVTAAGNTGSGMATAVGTGVGVWIAVGAQPRLDCEGQRRSNRGSMREGRSRVCPAVSHWMKSVHENGIRALSQRMTNQKDGDSVEVTERQGYCGFCTSMHERAMMRKSRGAVIDIGAACKVGSDASHTHGRSPSLSCWVWGRRVPGRFRIPVLTQSPRAHSRATHCPPRPTTGHHP